MTQKTLPTKLVFFTIFLDLVGFGIVLPILPLLALEYGASAFAALSLQAIFSLTQMLFAPIWGRISDRFGRRRVIVFTALGMSASYLAFGFAGSLIMLFVSRAFNGAFAANIATVQALIADNTSKEERAAGMSIVGVAIGLGFVFGPILAGIATYFGNIKSPFYIAAVLCLVNSIWAYTQLPKDRPVSHAKKSQTSFLTYFKRNSNLRFNLVYLFFVMFSFAIMESSIVIYTNFTFSFDVSDNAFLFALFGFCLATTQMTLAKKLTRILGDYRASLLGGLLMGIATYILLSTNNQLVFFVSVILFAIGDGICFPNVMAAISKNVLEDNQGEIMGVTQSITAAARIIAPIVAGLFFDSVGAIYLYLFSATIMLTLSGFGWMRCRRKLF